MHDSIEDWLEELSRGVNEARASDVFREWLDVQSRFHDYSARNSLLISLQCPEATRVAGYRTWQNEFDRHVTEGESAIWIWAPIITRKCPACGNSASYHSSSACEYDASPPGEWERGLVGFRPTAVFDISQTEGEPLPELDTTASGDPGSMISDLLDAAPSLDISVEIIPREEWQHGRARGVCQYPSDGPEVGVVARENEADLASTLCHEYAHALLHNETAEDRSVREVEAESVAYVVGRACGLEMSGSSFYLAAWTGDETDVLRERLDRITRTSNTILEHLTPDSSP